MNYDPYHPDPKAMKRVPAMDPPTQCHLCIGEVVIVGHEEIYGGRKFGDWPWVYRCNGCGARVGMHPGTNIPLGTLADAPTRAARNELKKEFNRIWQDGWMNRSAAYAWLADQMDLDPSECHFGLFDVEQCREADRVCSEYLEIME